MLTSFCKQVNLLSSHGAFTGVVHQPCHRELQSRTICGLTYYAPQLKRVSTSHYIGYVHAGVKSGTLLQQNGQLVALVQELQAVLETDKMLVVICPRAALVSEKYVRTRMRMWGAIAKYKV